MRIERVELTPYALPFAKPYVTVRGRLERREMILVRLHADSGEQGLGEAVPLSLRGGEQLGRVMADLQSARELIEQGGEPSMLLGRCRMLGICAPALAALDIALLDLAAQAAERPVWSLLGADSSAPVRCNATLVAGAPDEVAADARRWADRGFDTFKLKVGGADDVAAVRATREALGPDARLRIDANGSWTTGGAAMQMAALEPSGIELVEQPCAELAELAEVRVGSPIPIVADESVTSADDARRAVDMKACDAATIKLSKVGGIAAAHAIADTLPSYLSSALDGPVGIAAAAHLALALPQTQFAHGLATQLLFSEWPAIRSVPLEGAALRPDQRPGLGVELDDEAIARLTIAVS